MKIKQLKTDSILPNEDNIKVHTKRQVEMLAEKIKKFGFNQPLIIDENNKLLVGHCRLESAKYMGLEEVPCVVYDSLTDEEKKELMVSDNKLNESDWDVRNILKIDPNILVMSGFTVNEIEKMKDLDLEPDKVEKFSIDKMELAGFEKYDYIVVVFRDESDILNAYQKLGIKKVEFSFGEVKKIGLGRVIEGKDLLEKLK